LPPWGAAKRIGFRFVFVYLVLYILPFPLDLIRLYDVIARPTPTVWNAPILWLRDYVLNPYEELWKAVGVWVGGYVFGTEIQYFPAGSGDTTYNYVLVACFAAVAAVVTALWTAVDRKRVRYDRLFRALRFYVRFKLAAAMLTYGVAKVSQFPAPSLDRLLQPLGEFSPMGLLWTFMGASTAYTWVAGAGELLGGVLLTARRTTLLGALVSIGVLGNVVAMNLCYDVPVKLYAMHLLAMGVFLTLPDLGRLADLFVLNRPVPAVPLRPLFHSRPLHYGALALRTALVLAFVGMLLSILNPRSRGRVAERSPLYGVWNVEEFEVDGQVRPPLLSDALRWRRVVFDNPRALSIYDMEGARKLYALNLDQNASELTLTARGGSGPGPRFTYSQPEPEILTLEGTFNDHKLRARLRRDDRPFLLTSRGFHWVNEVPFQR
jgi:hypothetical protein